MDKVLKRDMCLLDMSGLIVLLLLVQMATPGSVRASTEVWSPIGANSAEYWTLIAPSGTLRAFLGKGKKMRDVLRNSPTIFLASGAG